MKSVFSIKRLAVILILTFVSKSVSATNWYVNDGSLSGDVYTTAVGSNSNSGTASAPFLTIQHAINTALAGDFIYVDAGTYVEQINISKSLSIIGAARSGPSTTAINAPAAFFFVANANSANHLPIVYASGAGNTINIDKVLVSGNGGRNFTRFYGVYYYEASGSFTNSRITQIRQGTYNGVQNLIAFFANHEFDIALTHTVIVDNNIIDDYQKGGIVINELNTQGIVTNNTITGQNLVAVNGQNGIQFGYGAWGTIQGNTVTNNLWNNSSDVATGILLAGVGVNFSNLATGNTLTIGGAGALANNLSGNEVGVLADDGGFGYGSNQGVLYNGDNYSNNYIHVAELSPSTVPSALNTYDKRVDNTSITNTVYGRIQRAIDGASATHTLIASAGTFKENPNINKQLTLKGNNFGVDARAVRPNPETIVMTNGNQANLFTVTASGVIIDGFTIDGDDPAAIGVSSASGSDLNASIGVRQNSGNTLTVSNNIIKKLAIGVRSDIAANGSLINQNWFDEIGFFDFGYAVSLRNNYYADVTNNKMTKVWTGGHLNNHNGTGGPASWNFTGNEVHSYAGGLLYWLNFNGATPLTADDNQFFAEVGAVPNNFGILIVSLQNAVNPSFTNNTINGTDYGVGIFNAPTTGTVTLGPTNTITGTKIAGVFLTNNLNFNPVGLTNFLAGGAGAPSTVNIAGIALSSAAGGAGLKLDGSHVTPNVQTFNLSAATTTNGGATGLSVNGGPTAITGNSINNLSFVGQTGDYITLSNGALDNLYIDATASGFDGNTGATATFAENFAIEDKVLHAQDNTSLGFIRVKAMEDFVTPNSGSVQRGVQNASNGWTVNVDFGTYNETVNGDFKDNLTVRGGDAMNRPTINGSTHFTPSNDLKLENLILKNSAGTTVAVVGGTNLTLERVTVDGENGLSRFGMTGGQVNGDVTITNSEFLNIRQWSAFDTRSGSGGPLSGALLNNVVFTGNLIDNTVGHINFRGTIGSPTPSVLISNNTVQNGGSATNSFGGIIKVFYATDVIFTENTIKDVGTSGYHPGGEAAYGAGFMPRNVTNLTVTRNTFENNNQAIAIEPRNSVQGGFNDGVLPNGMMEENFFVDNVYGVYVPATLHPSSNLAGLTIHRNSFEGSSSAAIHNGYVGGQLNATCNWYGSADFAVISPQIQGDVLYIPYLTDGFDGSGDPGFQPTESCDGPQPSISFTATNVRTGLGGSTVNNSPSTVTVDFCQGDRLQLSGYSDAPSGKVGMITNYTSTGNITVGGSPLPQNGSDLHVSRGLAMQNFFGGNYGDYGLSSGNSGSVDQTFALYYDANDDGNYDPDTDIQGSTITLHYNIYANPACSITGDDPVCPSSTNSYEGPSGMASYSWSITAGDATIDGPSDEQNVSVIAGSGCNTSYTLTLTVTNENGCSSTCQKIVTVIDNTSPTIDTEASDANAECQGTSPNSNTAYIAWLADNGGAEASDGCSSVTWSNNSGTQTWSGGCSNQIEITFTAEDACGNQSSTSASFTINDTQGPTFTAPGDLTIAFTSSCTYTTPVPPTVVASDVCAGPVNAVSNDVVKKCGNNTIIERTWMASDGCGNTTTQVQTITVTDNNTKYIVYAMKEARFGENNDFNGSIGVKDANGKADFKKNADQPNTEFAKAATVNIQSPSTINSIIGAATDGPTPPANPYVGAPLSGNVTISSNGTYANDNVKNLTVKKGVTATLTGKNFGKVIIEENAKVTFSTQSTIDIEDLQVKKGKAGTTDVKFDQCTAVRIKDKVDVEEDSRINVAGGNKVTFYLGNKDFSVKADNVIVEANVMAPTGKLKITGGGNSFSTMSGWYVVEKVDGDAKNVMWMHNNACNQLRGPIAATTVQRDAPVIQSPDAFGVTVFPNPSRTDFRVQVSSPSEEPVTIRIVDVSGRILKNISNVKANTIITIGAELRGGTYFAEIQQATNHKTFETSENGVTLIC